MNGADHDQLLPCQDCQRLFSFSAAEARFAATKGFRDLPRRCAPCRRGRKQRRLAHQPHSATPANPVRTLNLAERSHTRPPRPQFEATCFVCGDVTRVHFSPSTGRPAFCAACYDARQRQGSGLVAPPALVEARP